MAAYPSTYTEKITQEIQKMPDEYLPALLEMVRLFRETVTLKPAEQSFSQGWKDAMKGETLPIDQQFWLKSSAEAVRARQIDSVLPRLNPGKEFKQVLDTIEYEKA